MKKINTINKRIKEKRREMKTLLQKKRQILFEEKNMNKPLVKYTLRLSPLLVTKVSKIAKQKKMAVSEFIRKLIFEY